VFRQKIEELKSDLIKESDQNKQQILKAQIHNFSNDLEHLYNLEKKTNETIRAN